MGIFTFIKPFFGCVHHLLSQILEFNQSIRIISLIVSTDKINLCNAEETQKLIWSGI